MAKGKYQQWLEPDGLIRIEGWARDGLTDEQIAHNMGITTTTFYRWKASYAEICEALKKGKEVIDFMVENALLKRALGYQYKEITWEEGAVTKEVVKEMAPDTTAQIFWLKNRKPREWRDRKETQLSGEVKTKNPFDDLTPDELRKLIKDG